MRKNVVWNGATAFSSPTTRAKTQKTPLANSARRGSLLGGTARHRRMGSVPSPSMAHKSQEADTMIEARANRRRNKTRHKHLLQEQSRTRSDDLVVPESGSRSNSTVQKDEAQLTD